MSEPQRLSVAISELIVRRGLNRRRNDSELATAWKSILDDRLRNGTEFLSLRDEVVRVAVWNSALKSELTSFHVERLLKELRAACPSVSIRQIRFELRTRQE